MLLAAQQKLAVADRGRGPKDFVVETIGRKQFEFRAGFDDEGDSRIVQQEDLAVVHPRGCREAGPFGEPLLIKKFAGLGIEAANDSTHLIQHVEAAAIQQRRRVAIRLEVLAPRDELARCRLVVGE